MFRDMGFSSDEDEWGLVYLWDNDVQESV
jgi:hypothetical protein